MTKDEVCDLIGWPLQRNMWRFPSEDPPAFGDLWEYSAPPAPGVSCYRAIQVLFDAESDRVVRATNHAVYHDIGYPVSWVGPSPQEIRGMKREVGTMRLKRPDGGSLVTRPVILIGSRLTVNANVEGQLRVRLLGENGEPIPGFDAADCPPVEGDSLDHAVQWKAPLSSLRGRPVQLDLSMRDAQLFAVNLVE